MSNQNLFGRAVVQPVVPRGDVLGTFETYPEAQKVVDALAHADLDIKKLSIVGNDLKTVERVTGRLSYGRAALAAALSGTWLGLMVGLVFLVVSPTPNLTSVASAALIGAGVGMLFGIGTYALNRRRRDFTSTHQVIAGNYQVIVESSLAAKAREALGKQPAVAAAAPAPAPTAPAPAAADDADKTEVLSADAEAEADEQSTKVLPADDRP